MAATLIVRRFWFGLGWAGLGRAWLDQACFVVLVWYEDSESLKCRRKSEHRADTDTGAPGHAVVVDVVVAAAGGHS